MLRWLVLALLLANAGFYAWRQGWLEPLHGVIGARPEGEREPHRLALQVNIENIRPVLADALQGAERPAAAPAGLSGAAASAVAAGETSAAPGVPSECLEAGPFSANELVAARASLVAALPGSVHSVRELPPPWWVLMGPFADAELLQKKRDELRRLGLVPEQVAGASGSPLLVLSRHATQALAEAELAALGERGVRSARAAAGGPLQHALRVPEADAAAQAGLAALSPQALRGKAFVACPAETQ